MEIDELKAILKKHVAWIRNDGGERADLSSTDLRGTNLHDADLRYADLSSTDLRGTNLYDADLRGASLSNADLRGANLDFSCFPLWCGSFDMKVDRRIAVQLLYHFCRLDIDDDEMKSLQKTLAPLANEFHRVRECGKIAAG